VRADPTLRGPLRTVYECVMATIAFSTIKGGVGKTTLCVHTAAALADAGHRVLLLDLDPQAHASLVLGLEPGDRPCVGDTFGPRPRHRMDEVLVPAPKRPDNLFIAPACLRMAAIERELFSWGHRLQTLPRALKTLSWTPDVVVIDTPPNIGAYTEAVLAFADTVVAPVPTGAFALQGLGEIETAWREVRESSGTLMAVVNLLDRRTTATNEAMEGALAELSVPVARARVPRSEAINQAGLAYEVVFDTSPHATGVEELRALAAELGRSVGLGRAAAR
jgi:chromosome partitioning protein